MESLNYASQKQNLNMSKSIRILKLFLVFGYAILLSKAFGQTKSTSDVTVEGSAKMKVQPDIITLTLSIEKTDTIENVSIKLLNEESDILVRSLENLGFPNGAIKILDYKVSRSYNEDRGKSYSASNILKVEFKLDTKIVDAFYSEIELKKVKDLDVSFETRLSDSLEKSSRLRLVQLAIVDAKNNSDNIAKALNLNLSKIKQVYKNNEVLSFMPNQLITMKFTPPKIIRDSETNYRSSFDKFQIEDIELEEKITIVYEIAK
jgi:uncharacterized protein YggE